MIGSHYLEIRVENLVTVPFNVIHEIPVEYIIEDYAFVADEHFVIPGTTVYFNITMTQGSRYLIKADYDYEYNESWVSEEIFVPVTVAGDVCGCTSLVHGSGQLYGQFNRDEQREHSMGHNTDHGAAPHPEHVNVHGFAYSLRAEVQTDPP